MTEKSSPQPAQGCQHKRYSLDKQEQVGHCLDCGAEGRMAFVVPAPEGGQLPNVAKTAPAKIHLVIGAGCPPEADFTDCDEVTWCKDKVDANSITYIRADLAAQPQAERDNSAFERGYQHGRQQERQILAAKSASSLDSAQPSNQVASQAPAEGDALTDERLLHLVDTHVGSPNPKYLLGNNDWINFARAAIAADRAARSRGQPDVQPKGAAEPVAEVRATGANSCELFFLPAGNQLKPGDKLYTGPAQAPAPAPEPVAYTVAGEITNWARDFSKYRTQHYTRPVYAQAHAPAGFVLFPAAARSDVLTAAGLVRHGKQCKALADRLGDAVATSLYAGLAVPSPAVKDDLREELAAAEKSVAVYMAERNQARDRVRELRAQLDAAERDAARYRFIRDADRCDDRIGFEELMTLAMESFDAAIDAAMRESDVPVQPTGGQQ